MSHLDPDRLAMIAMGEDPTSEETAHTTDCTECAIELAEIEHTVSVGRATASIGDLETPPERVWEGILTDVRAAKDREQQDAAPRRSSVLTRALVGLAAGIVLVVGIGGVWSVTRSAQVVELASATLDAFPDHAGSEGQATVVESSDGTLEVRVALDSDAADAGFREVWLIRADASALVSLGTLEGSDGVFSVPADVDIHDYVLVDISQEDDDGDPAHSGDSIVRGELQFS